MRFIRVLLLPPSYIMTVAAKVFLTFIRRDSDSLFGEPSASTEARYVEFRFPVSMPGNAGVKVTGLSMTDTANWAIGRGFLGMAIDTVGPEGVGDLDAANGTIRFIQTLIRQIVFPVPNAFVRAVEAARATVIESSVWHSLLDFYRCNLFSALVFILDPQTA
jgi:hypothetical protein